MWSTERPTKPGWWWWRYAKGSPEHVMKVYESLAVEGLNGEADHVDEIEGEWQPVHPPTEAGQETACYCCSENGCEHGCRCSVLPRFPGGEAIMKDDE